VPALVGGRRSPSKSVVARRGDVAPVAAVALCATGFARSIPVYLCTAITDAMRLPLPPRLSVAVTGALAGAEGPEVAFHKNVCTSLLPLDPVSAFATSLHERPSPETPLTDTVRVASFL
jgi:hypothetical protein